MFQIQKISAHIQLLTNRRIKLEAHRVYLESQFDPDPSKVTFADRNRIQEVQRQIDRMTSQITQYQAKLDKFRSLSS